LLALLGTTVAQTANQQCFERYLQPIVVLLCALAALALAGRRAIVWPLACAAAVALALSVVNVFRVGA
jgi:hypothetical protein